MSRLGVVKRLFGSVLVVGMLATGMAAVPGWGPSASASVSGELADISNLKMMFEEERMAHDLYVALGERWGSRKFSNISRSESQHNSLVGQQLDRLGIERPDASMAGKFENQELQELYDSWLTRGMQSQADAFRVGAELERRDIADLEKVIAETSDPVLKDVYGKLLNGSKNHLAAFEAASGGDSDTVTSMSGKGGGWRGGRG